MSGPRSRVVLCGQLGLEIDGPSCTAASASGPSRSPAAERRSSALAGVIAALPSLSRDRAHRNGEQRIDETADRRGGAMEVARRLRVPGRATRTGRDALQRSRS
jgi:hypothetical protein